MKQLSPHVADYSFELDPEMTLSANDTLVPHFTYEKPLVKKATDGIIAGAKQAIDRRVTVLNNPNDILDNIEWGVLGLDRLDTKIQELLTKLDISLPDKLTLPATIFLISNSLASKIMVKQNHIVAEFDPRIFGMISIQSQSMLPPIRHPSSKSR
mmetsp:Transcript_42032/g.64394  ORF Transcript_42032/g.64394 Transcript_42032/m.64394 type:complete len:155 (+) Transcript_42032:507-971(+)